jgi:hypothetical protein
MRRPVAISKKKIAVLGRGVLGLAVLGLGCADKTPARIDFTAPPPFIMKQSRIALEASVVNKDGVAIDGAVVSYAATPAEVVKVSSDGSLLCLKTGDASIALSGAGLTTAIPLKCRIPTEIVLPETTQFILGSEPVTLRATALTEGRQPMADVPVELTAPDSSILKIEGNRAVPVSIGKTVLKATAGSVTAMGPVEVVERVVSERMTLEDGKARSWTLERGAYRVEIDVTTSRKIAHGVTTAWEGSKCEAQPERQSHRISCTVLDRATFSVTNPETYGLGLTVTGTTTIYRVPPT